MKEREEDLAREQGNEEDSEQREQFNWRFFSWEGQTDKWTKQVYQAAICRAQRPTIITHLSSVKGEGRNA